MSEVSVKVESVIPKPAHVIYQAMVDPVKMSNYFISYSDHEMEEGKNIHWEFADAGVGLQILVKKTVRDSLILFSWGTTGEETMVEISLESLGEQTTKVLIRENEWKMNETGVKKALQQTQGWTDFLCCLKAYLLFDVNLRKGEKIKLV